MSVVNRNGFRDYKSSEEYTWDKIEGIIYLILFISIPTLVILFDHYYL